MKEPRAVIVKTMTVDRPVDTVFDFLANPKNWESGGALKNIREDGGWWHADSPVGPAKFRMRHNREYGILDHDFVAGQMQWTVFSRVVKNERGSTTSWTFIRPENMSQEQFEGQLLGFETEIDGWKKDLESR